MVYAVDVNLKAAAFVSLSCSMYLRILLFCQVMCYLPDMKPMCISYVSTKCSEELDRWSGNGSIL
jgi:hypothetical protein